MIFIKLIFFGLYNIGFSPKQQKMNKTSVKRKAIVLLLVLAMGVPLPVNALAQGYARHGGLFDYYDWLYMKEGERSLLRHNDAVGGYTLYNQQFGSDQEGGYELYNQTFGQEVPLGSGLLILTAAGASYAIRKRKNNGKNQKS